MTNKNNAGFSLIELSIVIIILGLLAVGITAGQSLIKAAELRSITADVHKLTTSMYAFKTKYLAFPGDFSQGTTLYPTTFNGLHVNGNGDGQIRVRAGSGTNSYESHQAWFHLNEAGMLDTSITPLNGNTAPSTQISPPNVPPSKIANAGYTIQHGSALTYNTVVIGGQNAFAAYHVIFFGIPNTASAASAAGNLRVTATLTPEDALNLDRKSDDGRADAGAIRGINGLTPIAGNCLTGTTYNAAVTSPACGLVFQI